MKEYMKPQIRIECIIADTDTSIVSDCEKCPAGSDCVNAAIGTNTYDKNGIATFCNYGSKYLGCI